MQDFMKLYSGLVERCFTSCCNDFTSKALSSKEVGFNVSCGTIAPVTLASSYANASNPFNQNTCVQNCTEKFLKHSERVGARFAEQNAGTWFIPLFLPYGL